MPEYKDVDKNDMPKYLSVIEEMVLNCKHHSDRRQSAPRNFRFSEHFSLCL